MEVSEPSVSAAVALICAPDADDLQTLFIRRAERAGDPWSGQVGLPGGRRGPADADLLDTAQRETKEEVGIDLHNGECLGALDDVRPLTPRLPSVVVRPFVFLLGAPAPARTGSEVASAFWVPLERLFGHSAREVEIELGGENRRLPAYVIGPDVIWGMTYRILGSLLAALRGDSR
jgi:8-oxo-dGTP pyrophosphatase MutT (NUDIX family)